MATVIALPLKAVKDALTLKMQSVQRAQKQTTNDAIKDILQQEIAGLQEALNTARETK